MNTQPETVTAVPLAGVFRRISKAELARRLGVSSMAVSKWIKHEVPLPRCVEIEAATAGEVRCEDLRPDVTWCRDESGAVTGYTIPVTTTAPTEKVA